MHYEKSISLNLPRAELWTMLANTDRFNREIGLPSVRYAFSPVDSGGSSIRAEARMFGLKLVWQEMPFEWVEPQWFRVRRIYDSGPFAEIVGGVRLEEREGGTVATCFADVTPRNFIGKAAAPFLIGKKTAQDFVKACQNFESYYQRRLNTPYPGQMATPKSVDRRRLAEAMDALRKEGASQSLLEKLQLQIETAPDSDLIRFRPFDLAEAWGGDRLAALTLCLRATRVGLLDLQWSVLCPSCRGAKQNYSHLRDLQPKQHCDACNIEYGPDFDRFVEVRFTVNPNVRKVEDMIYCVGGPMNTPHIRAQLSVASEKSSDISLRLTPGRMRVRSLQIPKPGDFTVSPASSHENGNVSIDDAAIQCEPSDLTSEGDASLRFTNKAGSDVLIKLENEAWSDRGASASLVTSLQEFRDLFSSEVLAPGLELAIKNLALLFSDLKGSTRMYDSVGDAPAYGLVRKHFEFLAERIARSRGAIVKTIGDAVMAAFSSPADCVRAGIEIQKDLSVFNHENQHLPPLCLKLGAHCGPCIAVNANETLDYFGTTVNVAQRVQDQSEGEDIVLTDKMLEDTLVQSTIQEADAACLRFESKLKGFEDRFVLYRVKLRND